MELALQLTVLVAIVAAGSALSRRLGLPAPLLLVVVGVVASYIKVTGADGGPLRSGPEHSKRGAGRPRDVKLVAWR